MKKIYSGKLIQPLMAAAVFLILSVFYFLPQLQGKVIQQSDILAGKAMVHEAETWQEKTGRVMLWTNSMFGGMPTYQMSAPQKNNLLGAVNKVHQVFISRPIGYFFAAMLGCYIVLMCLGAGHWASMLGAVAFGLTTNQFVLYETGHMTKFMTIVYSSYVIGGAILAYQKKYLTGAILFAVGMGLSLFNNHIQMTYYLGIFLLAYVLVMLAIYVRRKDLATFAKASALLLAGVLIALGSYASKMWTTVELSEATMRGGPVLETPLESASEGSAVPGLDWEYAMRWSNGLKDIAAMFVPRAAGGSGSEMLSENAAVVKDLKSKGVKVDFGMPLYYGSLPFTAGPAYIGASVLFLFVFGLFYIRPSLRWWLLGAVILSILLSMGKYFAFMNKPIFDLLPLYNKFRAPSSILSLTALIIPLGAALGLGGFMKGHQKSFQRPIWIALGVVGGLCLLMALLGPSMMSFVGASDERLATQGWNVEALIKDRKSALAADAWRSVIWVLLCSAVIWVYHQGKIKQWLLLSGLGLLIIADLWAVGRRYIAPEDFTAKRNLEAIFDPRPVDQQILQDPALHYRVHDLSQDPFNSSMASYHHRTIGGYSPAKFQRYQDLIDRYIAQGNMNILNMLNTKYFIVNNKEEQPEVRTNPLAYGNAWFVENINLVNTNREELDALDTINLTQNVFIHKEFSDAVSGFDPSKAGQIELTSYAPDELIYKSSAPSEQLAVFSEIWYGPDKGWQAYIDGKEAPHIRADYALRAMKVPAGEHEIKFTFNPKSYRIGEILSLVFSLLIVGMLLYGLYIWLTTPPPMLPVPIADAVKVQKKLITKKKRK
ncbi:MAG TPA: YfhO family protein [Saprospiraceae bacterium]|nr:YfhO family protein [Saprospiraceae bacterium]